MCSYNIPGRNGPTGATAVASSQLTKKSSSHQQTHTHTHIYKQERKWKNNEKMRISDNDADDGTKNYYIHYFI
jgi:hypothetical protein